MRRILIGLCSLMAGFTAQAQLVNDGATIVVKPGATLFVETNVSNNGAGTLTVEGTLEVQGNLTNTPTATMATTGVGVIKFSGTGPSTLTSAGDAIGRLENAKTGAGITTLADAATVTTELKMTSNNLNIAGNNLTLGSAITAVTGAPGAGSYIQADGAGQVKKEVTANGSFAFPVGDNNDYSPISSTYTGASYASANIGVSVVDAIHPTPPAGQTDYISRYWNVDASGITAPYSNSLIGTYAAAGDLVGADAKAKGAALPDGGTATQWTHFAAAEGASNVSGTTTNLLSDFSGTNLFGKVTLTAYLAGALPSGTTMTTFLNSVLPLATPYSAAPFNAPVVTATSIPATATDWILVEARDAATPATVLSQTSAFLLSNGNIVNIDGSPLTLKDANASSHIALRHRNHLAIRTASPLDVTAFPITTHNFSTGTGQAYTGCTSCSNPTQNMKQIGSVYAMWAGDVDKNARVRYLPLSFPPPAVPSDALSILAALGGNQNGSLNNVYSFFDVNMDAKVRYLPISFPPPAVPSDALYLLSNTLAGVSNADFKAHQ